MFVALRIVGEFASLTGLFGSFYCMAETFIIHRVMRPNKYRTAAIVATRPKHKFLTPSAQLPILHAAPAVTVFKPLFGATPRLREYLETLFAQDYSGPIQIVFGLHNRLDPAKAIVEQLKRQHPFADIKIVVDSSGHGTNAKITNLLNMVPLAKHPIFVISDGDTAVGPNWLSSVVSTLEEPGIGLVSCLYSGVPERPQFWPLMSAMGMSYSFLPSVFLAAAAGLEVPCLGASIAVRRSTLAAIGGFERFADTLADDYDLGNAVRSAGYGVALSTTAVLHNAGESSIFAFFSHELRWARTIRMINPIGYALSGVTFNVGFSVLGAVSNPTTISLAILAAAIAARTLLQRVVDYAFGSWSGPALLLPLRDILGFVVFFLSFASKKVRWGERSFDTSRHHGTTFREAISTFRSKNALNA